MLQKIALVLADGSVELLSSVEDDLWEETADEIGSMGPHGLQLRAVSTNFQLPGASFRLARAHCLSSCLIAMPI